MEIEGIRLHSDITERVLYVLQTTHNSVFRQDFQKVNGMDCFKFYMPDFENKEIDMEMIRAIFQYQTARTLWGLAA